MSDTTSRYTEEGTLAHAIAENKLRAFNREGPRRGFTNKINALKKSDLYYPGMIDEVQDYTDFCIETFNGMRGLARMEVEQSLDLDRWVPQSFGTGDCVLVNSDELHIIDLKFGTGVEVSPVNNPQLMLYALGAYESWSFIFPEIKKIKMTIAQVRLKHIETYELPILELLEWGDSIKEPARKAYAGEGEREAGTWCKFCKVKATCRARKDWALKDIDPERDPNTISIKEIAELLHRADTVVEWAKDLKDYALQQALEGEHFDGWKLVEGRSTRKITDEEALAERLVGAGYSDFDIYKPRSLEGITNLTKLIGAKKFGELAEGLIDKPAGKPTLVVESDKRPALDSAENEFEFKEER